MWVCGCVGVWVGVWVCRCVCGWVRGWGCGWVCGRVCGWVCGWVCGCGHSFIQQATTHSDTSNRPRLELPVIFGTPIREGRGGGERGRGEGPPPRRPNIASQLENYGLWWRAAGGPGGGEPPPPPPPPHSSPHFHGRWAGTLQPAACRVARPAMPLPRLAAVSQPTAA